MRILGILSILFFSGMSMFAQNKLEVEGKAKITVMDTVTNVSSNVVRQSDGTLALRQYKIGDFTQGGIVFWVDETGEHGLACDTADISSGIPWNNGVYKVTNARGDGAGSGEMNTMLIVAQQTIDNIAGTFAALICANLVRGLYGDWYLPSKVELNLMYQNKALIDAAAIAHGGSAFTSGFFWSSTEDDDDSAWAHNFFNGFVSLGDKASFLDVRAVRAF